MDSIVDPTQGAERRKKELPNRMISPTAWGGGLMSDSGGRLKLMSYGGVFAGPMIHVVTSIRCESLPMVGCTKVEHDDDLPIYQIVPRLGDH